jgi:hypothetical protein
MIRAILLSATVTCSSTAFIDRLSAADFFESGSFVHRHVIGLVAFDQILELLGRGAAVEVLNLVAETIFFLIVFWTRPASEFHVTRSPSLNSCFIDMISCFWFYCFDDDRCGLFVAAGSCLQESCLFKPVQQHVKINQSGIRVPAFQSSVNGLVIEWLLKAQPTL